MSVKAVVFDWFGTLTCTTSPEWGIIKRWKLDPKMHSALQRAVCGQKFRGWRGYLEKIIEQLPVENTAANRAKIKKIVLSECERGKRNVSPSAKKVLAALQKKGYVLGLVSNAYPPTRKAIAENNLLRYFKKKAVILSYEVGTTKQQPQIFRICLKRLGVPAEKTVIVGDSLQSDILMARKATKGKINGVLIARKPDAAARKAGCIIVHGLAAVPKALNLIK